MATPPNNVPTVPNTPLLNDRSDGSARPPPPSGPCNYINVNVGGSVPRCGCRRFTDKSEYGLVERGRQGWCVCEHHSCFHNHDPVDGFRAASEGRLMVEGAATSTSTPRQDVQVQVHAHSAPDATRRDVTMQDVPEVGQQQQQPGRESLADTVQWNRFIKSGSSQGSLPAIPSQCLLPSDSGSRASSSTGHIRPFAGRGLQTLSHIPKGGSPIGRNAVNLGKGRIFGENGKAMQIYEDSNGHGFLQSVTEVATPSARSSQDVDEAFNRDVSKAQNALQRIEEERTVDVPTGSNDSITVRNESSDDKLLPRIRSVISHIADYPMTRRNHEHRLDQLENASFSNAAVDNLREEHENLRDDHEQLDIRMGEVETRLKDVENQQMAQSDTNSVTSRQLVNTSMDSRSSSAMIANAIDGLDYSRIEALEAHISELQALAPPTNSRPWEVEVVFLPFGPRLKGIWSSSQASTTQLSRVNSASGDEWTQTQNNSMAAAQARLTAHDQTVAWETLAADLSEHPAPWLMPKACGSGTRMDERLRSRGLVRKIQIRGPDARDVQAAMLTAFGDLPNILAEDPYSHRDHRSSIPDTMNHFFGLQAPWIPLRKLHKNSCLRFLNTSEMITPALWTVQFLSSSVAMRSTGVRRLYVTHADSYTQRLGSTVSWTWQKIRQLDRVYPDGLSDTPEGDAEEPCWTYDDRYDQPPSLSSSLSSHNSLTIRPISYEPLEPASPSDHFSSAPVPRPSSSSPTPSLPSPQNNRQYSPLKERHPFRPLHARTTSLPSLAVPLKSSLSSQPLQPGPNQPPKRPHPTSSPTRPTTSLNLTLAQQKRQRTRSPSRIDTPRWSVPPSPSPFAEDHKRQTTPFAYATPHSNAPYIPRHLDDEDHEYGYGGDDDDDDGERGSTTNDSSIGGEGNALSDFAGGGVGEEAGDEIWEGMQEDDDNGSRRLVGGFLGEDEVEGRNSGYGDGDGDGDGSDSYPSEYPSTQQRRRHGDALARGSGDERKKKKKNDVVGAGAGAVAGVGVVGGETKGGFRIHVDEGEGVVR